ncbi:unnamed protein product, partial [Musa textilis]
GERGGCSGAVLEGRGDDLHNLLQHLRLPRAVLPRGAHTSPRPLAGRRSTSTSPSGPTASPRSPVTFICTSALAIKLLCCYKCKLMPTLLGCVVQWLSTLCVPSPAHICLICTRS